jgi:O-antigen ligase
MVHDPASPRTTSARALDLLAPALTAVAALSVFGLLGTQSPFAWLVLGPVALVSLALLMRTAPVLLFWSVPVSMYWFTYLPLMHYEFLALLCAGFTLVTSPIRTRLDRLRIPVLHGRYLIFLLSLLPGLVVAISPWRFFATFKLFALGLVGFEAARRGARRLGHEALLWGPTLFIAISTGMMMTRVAASGIPGFKSATLRSFLSEMPWGGSNYVAAVMVLCLPAMTLLARTSPARGWRRRTVVTVIGLTMIALLVTASRGGFALAAGYLVLLGVRNRRSLVPVAVAAVAFGIAVFATSFGQGMLSRFSSARSWDSAGFRVMIWQSAFERGWRHLPFGVGAGQGMIQEDRLQQIDPHNFLLQLFSESGPIAVALWLWLVATLWDRARRLRRDPATRMVGDAALGVVAMMFLNMLFEPTLSGNVYHLLFWWIVGILFGGAEAITLRKVPAPTTSTVLT